MEKIIKIIRDENGIFQKLEIKLSDRKTTLIKEKPIIVKELQQLSNQVSHDAELVPTYIAELLKDAQKPRNIHDQEQELDELAALLHLIVTEGYDEFYSFDDSDGFLDL